MIGGPEIDDHLSWDVRVGRLGILTDVAVQPEVESARPSVVAPAEDYMPKSAILVEGEKVVVRSGGHEVVAHLGLTTYRIDGKIVDYGQAPTMIGSRLYLPLDLLTMLSGSR